MSDLLFDWFRFDQTSKAVANSTIAKQLNPNKTKRRSLKLVYSDHRKNRLNGQIDRL